MYYLTIVQNNSAVVSYSFSDIDSALVMFHNELAYRADARTSTMCVIIDEKGDTVKRGYYNAE